MNAPLSLGHLRVASPCDQSWDEMHGNQKARVCSVCSKHVDNFAAMTTEEGLALIKATEGGFCGRLTRRADGTLMTADCPVGLAARMSRFRRRLVYTIMAIGLFACGFLSLRHSRSGSEREPLNDQSSFKEDIKRWVETIRIWAGFPPRCKALAGTIMMGGCPAPPSK